MIPQSIWVNSLSVRFYKVHQFLEIDKRVSTVERANTLITSRCPGLSRAHLLHKYNRFLAYYRKKGDMIGMDNRLCKNGRGVEKDFFWREEGYQSMLDFLHYKQNYWFKIFTANPHVTFSNYKELSDFSLCEHRQMDIKGCSHWRLLEPHMEQSLDDLGKEVESVPEFVEGLC